ncbi:secreted RxLR effector protein 161-like [Primulina eburnea]|uniref:secreted RxLR effector protein 161-like n=1 Tax=Primulina eburnea TaxID=1245227 RepID=UPI003C6BFC53
MALVAHFDLELHQMDVKTTFLNGNIDETIYMMEPENFVSGRYLCNPRMDHWKAAKRVMRYLQRTKDHMLTYRKSDNLEIIGYSDSDFARCEDSKRSTSGYIYLLAGGAISWKSAKQTLIASSTMAAEFVACYEASNHGI